jgi:predicted enzyme related to lactoylglutathione lyase
VSARPGVVVYAKDVAAVAAFYESVAGLVVAEVAEGHVALVSDALELIVVGIPAELAGTIEIARPPQRREGTPIKPVLPVASLALARERARSAGGVLDGADCEWRWGGALVCDGHDPEGNVFQLRETPLRAGPATV